MSRDATALPNLADAPWFEARSVKAVFAALDRDGEETRIVGGAIRNALMNRPVREGDFATTAPPDVVTARAAAAGLKPVPTGFDHGTVTVIAHGEPHEVTTLRRDVETDGRRAKVAFGRDWTADARRRDFTINALYLDSQGRIHDPLGGYPDIAARRVRFIGSAATRINEDALRILRFFRFSADYGEGPLDPDGFSACIRARTHLARLSRERIRQELLKLLVARRAVPMIGIMAEAGFVDRVLAGVPYLAPFRRLAEIEGSGHADALLRLAALAAAIPEDAERLAERLRLSNEEHARLRAAATAWRGLGLRLSPRQARAAIYRLGPAAFRDALRLAWARSSDPDAETWPDLLRLAQEWQPPRLALTGADVLRLGVPKGPAVGEALRHVENWWIGADFPDDPARLRAALCRAVAEIRNGRRARPCKHGIRPPPRSA